MNIDFLLNQSINPLVKMFIKGFESVMPIPSLNCFLSEEINQIFMGDFNKNSWNYKELQEEVKPSYGYSNKK